MKEKESLYRVLAYNCHGTTMISCLLWMIPRKPSKGGYGFLNLVWFKIYCNVKRKDGVWLILTLFIWYQQLQLGFFFVCALIMWRSILSDSENFMSHSLHLVSRMTFSLLKNLMKVIFNLTLKMFIKNKISL